MAAPAPTKTILWWGRFDPHYSRNRILRGILAECGYRLCDFQPRSSLTGGIEACFADLPAANVVWVPTFRQRDFRAARRYADNRGLPLIFDPLISAWDKAVFERKKFAENSRRSARLLAWERSLYSRADIVIADSAPHASFFIETLGARPEKTFVVPVGAEEHLFSYQQFHVANRPPEFLFFGSYIGLQGPEVIIEAAARLPEAGWTMLGDGPLRAACEARCNGLPQVRFENWLPYEQLAGRIGEADILLGIFGASPKAGRVIPNKVYQALACGRPLITRLSEAYPDGLGTDMRDGIIFVPPADPEALAVAAACLLAHPERYQQWGLRARQSYDTFFSTAQIKKALLTALAEVIDQPAGSPPAPTL